MLAIFDIISVRYISRVFVAIRLKDVNVDGIDSEFIFSEVMEYMKDNNISLGGAVHDFTCPQTGKNNMYFPIRKL